MIIRILITLCSLLLSLPAVSAWYEATGQARIIGDDVETARAAAMRDAVKNALVFAGASISSVQEVAGGVLTHDSFEVRSGGTVRDLRLINETQSGNTLQVTIQADLFPANALCESASYRKSLTLLRFGLLHREQAREGEIFEIGSALTQASFDMFKQRSEYSYPRQWVDNRISLALDEYTGPGDEAFALAESLAEKLNSQYFLTAQIRDLSMESKSLDSWRMWFQSPPERFFEIEAVLIDALRQKIVMRKTYRTQGEWDFQRNSIIDPYSQTFAQSPFGEAIHKTLSELQEDVDVALSCAPLMAQIVDIRDNQVLLNVGRRNGLAVGDKLKIKQKLMMKRLNSRRHNRYQETDITLTVTEATSDTLIARPASPEALAGVQIYDLVVRN